DVGVVGQERQRFDAEQQAVFGVGRALQRGHRPEIGTGGAAQAGERAHAGLAWSAARLVFCRPARSEVSGASPRSNVALRTGHSLSSIENQAVSRLRPLTIMCWRKTPS